MRLNDKIAVITGSSRGIGRATAIFFAKEGAKVVVNYKSGKEKGEEIIHEIGDGGLLVSADVTREDDVKSLVEKTMKTFGRIDILVNNAGEILRTGDWKTDIELWHKTLDANLTSAWLVTREIAPIMLEQKRGAIVNLGSTVGILGVASVLAYSCAKGGIVSMTKAFRESTCAIYTGKRCCTQ